MKKLMIGNAAIARGAYEAGVTVATAYPGTPSTEIVNSFAQYAGVYAEWSPNEKVALEVGAGASIAGARTLVAMKHVGVNVAADPLYYFCLYGSKRGAGHRIWLMTRDCIPPRMNRTTVVMGALPKCRLLSLLIVRRPWTLLKWLLISVNSLTPWLCSE